MDCSGIWYRHKFPYFSLKLHSDRISCCTKNTNPPTHLNRDSVFRLLLIKHSRLWQNRIYLGEKQPGITLQWPITKRVIRPAAIMTKPQWLESNYNVSCVWLWKPTVLISLTPWLFFGSKCAFSSSVDADNYKTGIAHRLERCAQNIKGIFFVWPSVSLVSTQFSLVHQFKVHPNYMLYITLWKKQLKNGGYIFVDSQPPWNDLFHSQIFNPLAFGKCGRAVSLNCFIPI